MRRRSVRSLFDEDEPAEYLVDTSSWIALAQHDRRTVIWHVVERLIVQQRLYSPALVVGTSTTAGEVISARDLVAPHIHQLVKCDRNDEAYLLKVGEIARRYRRLSKPDGAKTKADPFLIALAILDGYTVVAEESLKRSVGKIPGVCEREHVSCVRLDELYERERRAV